MTLERLSTPDENDEAPAAPIEIPNWQDRAKSAEEELSVQRAKVAQQARRNRRLQYQIQESTEALGRCVHDCGLLRYHFQLISNSNIALSEELRKAKYMVQTLEAVIQMLYLLDSTKSTGCIQSLDREEGLEGEERLGGEEGQGGEEGLEGTESANFA